MHIPAEACQMPCRSHPSLIGRHLQGSPEQPQGPAYLVALADIGHSSSIRSQRNTPVFGVVDYLEGLVVQKVLSRQQFVLMGL